MLRPWNEQRGNVGDDKHFIQNFLNLNEEQLKKKKKRQNKIFVLPVFIP